MQFAYTQEIPNGGCEILLRTRSEVEPFTKDEGGINLHLVMTTGYQILCPIGVYRYSVGGWTSIDSVNDPFPYSAETFMSDSLRLPCEWIARNRSVSIELTSKTEGEQRYIDIDLRGFQNIRNPEGLVRFVINRMVHKAKIVLEYYGMKNNLE